MKDQEPLVRTGSALPDSPVPATASPVPADPLRSYDQHQADAQLRTCERCGRPWYFTDPTATICGDCRK